MSAEDIAAITEGLNTVQILVLAYIAATVYRVDKESKRHAVVTARLEKKLAHLLGRLGMSADTHTEDETA